MHPFSLVWRHCLLLLATVLLALPASASRADSPGKADWAAANKSLMDGDAARAAELYTKAITAGGWNEQQLWTLYRLRSKAHFQQTKDDQALADLNAAIRLKPSDTTALNIRADHYYRTDRNREALVDLDLVLKLDPKNAPAYYTRGQAYTEIGEYESAINDLTKAIELKPKEAPFYLSRSVAYDRSQKEEEALEDLNRSIELDPTSFLAHFNRASIYANRGELAKARADFDKAARLNSRVPVLFAYRGSVSIKLGDYTNGKADLEHALRLAPNDSPSLKDLAWLLATCPDEPLRDGPKAIELAKRAIENEDSPRWETREVLAAAYANAGDFDKAVATQKQAIELLSKSDGPKFRSLIGLTSRLDLYKNKKPYRDKPAATAAPSKSQ